MNTKIKMAEHKFDEFQCRHGYDYIGMNAACGVARLTNTDIVKTLNGLNDSCKSSEDEIAKLNQENQQLTQLLADEREKANARIEGLEMDIAMMMERM